MGVIINGASFIDFPIVPKKVRQNEDSEEAEPEPSIWLAFLKKQPDGRFLPVTGQYDATFSFFLIRRPPLKSFFQPPMLPTPQKGTQ